MAWRDESTVIRQLIKFFFCFTSVETPYPQGSELGVGREKCGGAPWWTM